MSLTSLLTPRQLKALLDSLRAPSEPRSSREPPQGLTTRDGTSRGVYRTCLPVVGALTPCSTEESLHSSYSPRQPRLQVTVGGSPPPASSGPVRARAPGLTVFGSNAARSQPPCAPISRSSHRLEAISVECLVRSVRRTVVQAANPSPSSNGRPDDQRDFSTVPFGLTFRCPPRRHHRQPCRTMRQP